jgi:hypothetical protein
MDNGLGFGKKRFLDIPGSDYYPIQGPTSEVGVMAQFIRNFQTHLVGDDPTGCVFIVPQLFYAYTLEFEPLYPQVRAEVYTAITAGAKGVFYYAYHDNNKIKNGMSLNPKRKNMWFLPESRLWDQIGELNKELISLKDVILLGTDSKEALVESKPSVFSKVLRLDRNLYILIVNSSAEKTSTAISFGRVQKKQEPLFASPAPVMVGPGHEKIILPPYGVAIYKTTDENP